MKNTNKILIALLLISALFGAHATAYAKTKKVSKPKVVKSQVVAKKEIQSLNVSLEVLGNKYSTKVPIGSNVLDVMNTLGKNKNNNFSFHSKDYSSLGSFVDEINGVKGTPGNYWLYYVNGKKASVGVSKYIIKEGDKIVWKQESF